MTRKGAAIYEFHGESEFEIEGVRFFDFLLKKKWVKICWTEEVFY